MADWFVRPWNEARLRHESLLICVIGRLGGVRVLARPALKGPCQLRGIVCSLSQGPWVTQSPWTAPSPWLTLWISAQTVSAGRGGTGQLPSSSLPPSSLSCSPAGAWGGGWPHPHFTEKPGRTVPSPSPALHPQAAGSVYTVPHEVCVSGVLGDGSYGYRGRGRAAPGPAERPGMGAWTPGLRLI